MNSEPRITPRLTSEQIARIRAIYESSEEVTQKGLAQRFGVKLSAIQRAVQGIRKDRPSR
jgi:hypothetical protein